MCCGLDHHDADLGGGADRDPENRVEADVDHPPTEHELIDQLLADASLSAHLACRTTANGASSTTSVASSGNSGVIASNFVCTIVNTTALRADLRRR